ncbi:MAG: hypothetical protein WCE30_17745 [Mycobacterium sp.]
MTILDNAIALHNPTIRYRSTNTCDSDAAMDWRADLHLYPVDGGDPIIGGYVDFVMVRISETDIAPALADIGGNAELFADLFDGPDLIADVDDQFEDTPFNNALLILDTHIEPPLRGHNLGAWMVAEVIARMAPVVDTLVALYPHPTPIPDDYSTHLGAIAALDAYWRTIGVIPLHGDPRILGHTTAYDTLSNARQALADVRDSVLRLPATATLPTTTAAKPAPATDAGHDPADDESASAQVIDDHQRLDVVEGITAAHDHIVLTDDRTHTSIGVHHRSWPALATAVKYFRSAHCDDCP